MNTEITTSTFTEAQARRVTDEIKRDGQALWQKVAEAYDGRIWIALGYQQGQAGWKAYIANEFPDGLLIPPKERQNDAIQHYLQQGMSTRAIAQVTDLSKDTVARRASEIRAITGHRGGSGVSFETPGNIQGVDGKQYASTQPSTGTSSDEVEDAEIIPEPEFGGSESSSEASVPGGHIHGSDAGFEPIDLSPANGKLELSGEPIREAIRAFNGTGRSQTVRVKRIARELSEYLVSPLHPVDAWDVDELAVMAEETVDVISVLTDLLVGMTEPNSTKGLSLNAINETKIKIETPLDEVQYQLENLSLLLMGQKANQ